MAAPKQEKIFAGGNLWHFWMPTQSTANQDSQLSWFF